MCFHPCNGGRLERDSSPPAFVPIHRRSGSQSEHSSFVSSALRMFLGVCPAALSEQWGRRRGREGGAVPPAGPAPPFCAPLLTLLTSHIFIWFLEVSFIETLSLGTTRMGISNVFELFPSW